MKDLKEQETINIYEAIADMVRIDMLENDLGYPCAKGRVLAMVEEKVNQKMKEWDLA